ncbi:MAG TPA: hypothetical protein VFC98_03530, partial [Clostridia bacterium]|nr:hypothetical protein [Clostridia bacterium]
IISQNWNCELFFQYVYTLDKAIFKQRNKVARGRHVARGRFVCHQIAGEVAEGDISRTLFQ